MRLNTKTVVSNNVIRDSINQTNILDSRGKWSKSKEHLLLIHNLSDIPNSGSLSKALVKFTTELT
jgi:hypothetical protein